MQYILLFLEGIITFISPCFLPMIPLYLSYFAGGDETNPEEKKRKTITNVSGFILGFTIIFVILGAFASSIGWILREHSTIINIVTGSLVVVLGLNYLGMLHFKFSKNTQINHRVIPINFKSSVLFGIIFSVGWTPCVGAFLGAALLRASQQGSMTQGMIMLFVFSMGLGVPLLASSLLMDRLKSTFDFIKKNYGIINKFAGGMLVAVGILMITGVFERFLMLFVIETLF